MRNVKIFSCRRDNDLDYDRIDISKDSVPYLG